ncbi:MAG: TetR/AcrR family transcriptional regulator [Nannocystaceae bacterium]|nr:TetR/AcrR family transcriptional regulator [bacterium]
MDHADIKRAILDVSLRLGTELGEEGLTMRAIARGLGVSATALYQHFESKAAILRELRNRAVERLDLFLAPAFEHPDPVVQLRTNAILYLRFSREHPWLYQLITEADEDWGVHSEPRRTAALSSIERTFGALQVCQSRGLLHETVDSQTAPLALWAAMHGMALLMNSGRVSPEHAHYPSAPLDDIGERFADYVLAGFLRR